MCAYPVISIKRAGVREKEEDRVRRRSEEEREREGEWGGNVYLQQN